MIDYVFFKKYQQLIKWLFLHCQWIFGAEKMGHRLYRSKKLVEVGPNYVIYELYFYYSSLKKQWLSFREAQFFCRAEYALKLQRFLFWLPVLIGKDFRTGDPILSPALIGLTVTDFYPSAGTAGTSCDGRVDCDLRPSEATFANLRTSAGTAGDPTGTLMGTGLHSSGNTNMFDVMQRIIFTFDTSSLGSSASISSATLKIYIQNNITTLASMNISLVESTPASNNTLVAADYGQVGTTQQASDITPSASAWNTWTLNSTGLSSISKTGISKFGVRYDADRTGTSPGWSSTSWAYIDVHTSDNSSGNKPDLTITYTTPVAKTLTETITDTDTILKFPQRPLLETITDTDSLLKYAKRTFSEILTNAATLTKQAGRILAETINHSDSIIRSIVRTFSEAFTNADSIIKSAARVLSESFTNSDTFAGLKIFYKTLSDVVSLADSITRNVFRSFTETVTHTDSLLKSASRALSELITNTDSLIKTSARVLTEITTSADSLIKSINRSLAETITNSDIFAATRLFVRSLTETITHSDTFSRLLVIGRTFSEVITHTDSLIKTLNGLVVDLWTRIAKPAGDAWTRIAKPAGDAWTRIAKPVSDLWTKITKPQQ
ncbi:MAG: hypothetical protein M1275_03185 [Patescibacteria group bacterium]|nr:hypothetical protein [Patescibacteria group bacterium]